MVYPPSFGHRHHDLVFLDYDGTVDDDLGVTLVDETTKRIMNSFGDFKKTRNIYLNFLNDFLKDLLFDKGLKLYFSYSPSHLVNINLKRLDVCLHKI